MLPVAGVFGKKPQKWEGGGIMVLPASKDFAGNCVYRSSHLSLFLVRHVMAPGEKPLQASEAVR